MPLNQWSARSLPVLQAEKRAHSGTSWFDFHSSTDDWFIGRNNATFHTQLDKTANTSLPKRPFCPSPCRTHLLHSPCQTTTAPQTLTMTKAPCKQHIPYSYALMYNKKSRFHFFLKNFWPHLPLSTWITKLRAMSLYYYFKSTLTTLSCPTVTRMPTQQQSPVWN